MKISTLGVSATYGLLAVVQTIEVVDWLTTEQSLLSNLTIVRAVFEKFSPVKVTVSPPSTEPNRGQILVRRGVEAAVNVTGVRGVETVPITTFGVQVKLSVWSAKD